METTVGTERAADAISAEQRTLTGVAGTGDRLYAITRADLPIGLRAAQVGHALIHWVLEYGAPPDSLVVLQVPSLEDLHRLHDRLVGRVVAFHEPDLGDELTALAAGPECRRALSSVPLLK